MEELNERLNTIRANMSKIKDTIRDAASKRGLSPDNVKIIAVTKTRSAKEIDLAIRSDISIIAENRVQEAEEKLPLLQERYDEFHFIGHLQKNKIKKLLPLNPSLIHSIDSLSTAKQLAQYLQAHNLQQDVLVQVNTSDEQSKYGLDNSIDEILRFVESLLKLERVQVRGLMTLAMYSENEKLVRNCFTSLRSHLEAISNEFKMPGMDTLSMGMSNDYHIAVEEGSNMVRIGSAIF